MTSSANAPDPQYDLAQAIQLTLDCIKAAAMDASTTSEARAAQRYLFERIMNYYALMRKRSLSASIEFLTPHSDGKFGVTTSGWYYKGLNTPQAGRNWIGPFASPKLARAARDADAPRSRFAFIEAQLDELATEEG